MQNNFHAMELLEPDILSGFQQLKISALSRAAKISSNADCCTISSELDSDKQNNCNRTLVNTSTLYAKPLNEKSKIHSNDSLSSKNFERKFRKRLNEYEQMPDCEIWKGNPDLNQTRPLNIFTPSSGQSKKNDSQEIFEDNNISNTSLDLSLEIVQVLTLDMISEMEQIDNVKKMKSENIKNVIEKLKQSRHEMNFKESETNCVNVNSLIECAIANNSQNQKRIIDNIESEFQKQVTAGNLKKNAIEQRRNKEMALLLREKAQKETKLLYEMILLYQMKFKVIYEKLARTLVTLDKHKHSNLENTNKSLKILVNGFDGIVKRTKSNEINKEDVKVAINLYNDIKSLEKNLLIEIENVQTADKIIENQHADIVEEPAPKIIESFEKPIVQNVEEPKIIQNININPITGFVSEESLKFYTAIMAFYANKVEKVKPLQLDDSMKKYRFSCQKAINTPVNAISSVSPLHLQDKFDKLFGIVSGLRVQTAEEAISCLDHPLGKDFCMLLLAKKFVSQGDSMISSNVQAAFPIAAVVISIWQNIPEFGTLFLAYIFKECPYLVPYFIPQYKEQSTEEYFKSLGYRYNNGLLEEQEIYLKRQSGIARLYAAVMIAKPRKDSNCPHPYGIENGWKWLCNLLNLEPLPNICATLLLEFLQIAGSEMWKVYGLQFVKLLHLIQNQYFPKLSEVDEGGPKARLEAFLQKVLSEGKINNTPGELPFGFW